MAGTGSSDSMGWALSVDVVLFPRREEKTPRGTDCLAVAVGVNGCGIEFDSAVPEPCCSWLVRGAELGGTHGAWKGTRGSLDMPDIVDSAFCSCRSMHCRYATPSELLGELP